MLQNFCRKPISQHAGLGDSLYSCVGMVGCELENDASRLIVSYRYAFCVSQCSRDKLHPTFVLAWQQTCHMIFELRPQECGW